MVNQQLPFALAALVLILHAFVSNSFRVPSTRNSVSNCANTRFQTSIHSSRIGDKNLGDMSFEQMVRTAELEEKAKVLQAKLDAVQLKKDSVKRKKDKEYESYWAKQKKTVNSRETMEKLYYSLEGKETLAQKLKKSPQSEFVSADETAVFQPKGKESEEFSAKDITKLGGLFAVSIVATFFIAQNVHFGYDSAIDDGWWTRL